MSEFNFEKMFEINFRKCPNKMIIRLLQNVDTESLCSLKTELITKDETTKTTRISLYFLIPKSN